MIKLVVYKENNKIIRYHGEGHAKYAEKGKDIVCAAVSSATQLAALGIIKHLRLKPVLKENDGLFCLDLKDIDMKGQEKQVGAILESMLLMLVEISKEYPNCIEIIEKEV